MAIEKTLQTRILNKVDTLENWQSSTLKIKNGEICIATIAATAGTGLTEPVCMIKIGGEEEKTFSELPWSFYAKASDVLPACKSDEALTAFIDGVIAKAGMASDADLEALVKRVTDAEGEIDTLQSEMDAVEAKAAANETALGEYKTSSDAAVQKNAADIAGEVTRAKAAEEANAGAISAIKDGETIDSFADVEVALAGKQATGDYATKSEAQGYADAKDEAIAAAQAAADKAQEEVDALEELVGTEAVADQIADAVAAEKERAEGIEGGLRTDVDAIKGDYLKAADKEALQNQINTIMNNPDAEGAINSINEFTAYVAEHGTIADGMRADINKNKDDIAAEVQRATGVEGGLDARLQAVEAAVGESGSVAGDIADALAEAKGYTDTEVKELADGAVAANATAIGALQTKVGDKTVAEQITDVTNPLAERVVALEAVDHDHANKTVLDGISAEKVSAWDAKIDDVTAAADSGIKATKTGNTIALELDDAIVYIFDCGNSEVYL